MTKRKKANNRRPDAVPRKALADAIRYRANEAGLNRELLGARVKDAASQMSRLMTGYDGDFSLDRLIGTAAQLGIEVTIVLQKRGPWTKHVRPVVVNMVGAKRKVSYGR